MSHALTDRQREELKTRGLSTAAVRSFEDLVTELGSRGFEVRQTRRSRIAKLEDLSDKLRAASASLEMCDNFSLARATSQSFGDYPKTKLSVHELATALKAYSVGAAAAVLEFSEKGPSRGPDNERPLYVAQQVRSVLLAHGVATDTLANKSLEAAIAVAFEVLDFRHGNPADYAKKAAGHQPVKRKFRSKSS